MVSFYQYLNFLDILSFKPELKIKGNSRFITNLGKTVSLICILSIIIMSFFIVLDVITRKTYTIIYNLDSRGIPRISYNESQIAMFLLDPLGGELTEPDRYFNILAKFWNVEINNNYDQNTTESKQSLLPKTTIIDLPVKNCSTLNFPKFASFYKSLPKIYPSVVCLDLINLNYTLFGKFGGVNGYSTINIYIRRCLNSTAQNKTNCFSDDEIDKKLSQVYLNLISIESDIDSNNFNNPILEFYKNDMLLLSTTIFKSFFKELNFIKFNSNNGYIFDSSKSFETYRTDNIMESVDLRGKNTLIPGTFGQVNIRSSGKTDIYYRSYLKLQASFAYIGGILQAVILIGKFFIYVYSQNAMLNYLFLHLFDYEEIKNIINKEKNIFSKPIISQISKINHRTDKNLKCLKNDDNKLKIQANNLKLFNSNSNSNLIANDNLNINDKKFTKFPISNQLININKNLNNIFVNNVNKKERNENFIIEESFVSKINDKLENHRKRDMNENKLNVKFGIIMKTQNLLGLMLLIKLN